jgi:hypothetical protein
MGSKNKRAKDAANAGRMKAKKIVRKVCRCPVCHRLIDLRGLANHIRVGCKR